VQLFHRGIHNLQHYKGIIIMTKLNAHLTLSDFRTLWANSSDRKESFSYEALEFIYDYLSDCECDITDIIAIDCDMVEQSAKDIAIDYNIEIPAGDDLRATVIEHLEENTVIVGISGDSITYYAF